MSSASTKQQIFDAALVLFARHGRAGARMQQIADAAQINKSMLHYYFSTKADLYDAVFAHAMERFMASFDRQALHEADSFSELLRRFISGYVAFCASHTDAMRLIVSENLRGGPLLGQHLKRMADAGTDTPPQIFRAAIESAIASGEIRPVDPDHALLTIIAGCIFPFIARPTVEQMHPASASDWDAFVETRKEQVFDVVHRGLVAPNAP
ncbi:MAG: TetR family transcriptional regulator [Longimonas sp.]|uniref:TetR/AcrR family transcriptional regulator n=1 Tax=Longimonas sp. TaxID=2039626 RepID=UPI003355C862